jgi:hypothetical protein
VTSQEIIEAVRTAQKKLRPGIGSRSKLLFTHPDNKEALGAVVKQVTETPRDIFCPFPFRVIGDCCLPKKEKKKTGRILWHDSRFITYSSGPAPGSPLSDEEYLEMCLYFGWAEEEEIEYTVWYEVDANTFEQFMQSAASIAHMQTERMNEKIARELFTKEAPNLSLDRRSILENFL